MWNFIWNWMVGLLVHNAVAVWRVKRQNVIIGIRYDIQDGALYIIRSCFLLFLQYVQNDTCANTWGKKDILGNRSDIINYWRWMVSGRGHPYLAKTQRGRGGGSLWPTFRRKRYIFSILKCSNKYKNLNNAYYVL